MYFSFKRFDSVVIFALEFLIWLFYSLLIFSTCFSFTFKLLFNLSIFPCYSIFIFNSNYNPSLHYLYFPVISLLFSYKTWSSFLNWASYFFVYLFSFIASSYLTITFSYFFKPFYCSAMIFIYS